MQFVKIMKNPYIFGIRHLSPAGAYHLNRFLEEKQPRIVLIEAPDNFNDQIENLTHKDTKFPVAILAYTKQTPVQTILYPMAEYSPEYQAVRWCKENKRECRFIDLPSDIFLALSDKKLEQKEDNENGESVYGRLNKQVGEDGYDIFWERTIEHTFDTEGYHKGSNLFGAKLREFEQGEMSREASTNLVREAYMRRKIKQVYEEGFLPEEIVVVTGSYHVEGLLDKRAQAMTDKEFQILPRLESTHTLMPYSNYRLSFRSGYGAGNQAPAYYELLWQGICRHDLQFASHHYLSGIARFQREHGTHISSAEVIEAVRLANALAKLRGGNTPALRDLRDAAITCLGSGQFSSINLAVAEVEIGRKIGNLPEGVSKTSIQEDFYRKLKELKLEKYRNIEENELSLDLRENRMVSSQWSAFLDLHRSFFLHQLRVLQISFARLQTVRQENATWAEKWRISWTPEAEIELVESALKGDTVVQAVSFALKERIENASNISEIALVIEDAFTCGMEGAVSYALTALQAMAVDAVSVRELASTVHRLSVVVQYGDIRKIESKVLFPVMQQLFYRACLIFPAECVCDDMAGKTMLEAMEQMNEASLAHDFSNGDAWITALNEISDRDDLNPRLSGYATAILLERGLIQEDDLRIQIQRRLSKGIPADMGAGWFEGLSLKNRYALIARVSIWESLDTYLADLDDEEFKRSLVFLRRAFADFSSREKDEIAENLGEIWGLNGQQVSEVLNAELEENEQNLVESLDDFDFDF